MSTTNKKVYVYKMNLIPANVLSIVILILAAALAFFLRVELWNNKMNYFMVFILIILYLMLHELLHGIGYFLGGTKRKYITYGIELEKGIFYAMAYSKLTKKNILISLQMPFMVIGVIFLYKAVGQALSILSMVGLIMLVGIVVNNGIILVDYTNLLVGRGVPVKQACFEAGKSRLRPVLMTTLTTILGMLPMCFAKEGQAMMVQPIGMAVVGGLTSSTFVTLFIIPVLYSLVMHKKTKKNKDALIKTEEEK